MPSLREKVRATVGAALDPNRPSFDEWRTLKNTIHAYGQGSSAVVRGAVTGSEDIERILALPRRAQFDLDTVTGAALVELMTQRLARKRSTACVCASMGRPCIEKLRPAQAWALYEAPIAGGLFGPIGVGHGKTALDFLMAAMMPDCKQAILLIPPKSRDTLKAEYLRWREHFIVPSLVMGESGFIEKGMPVLHVIPYSILSRPESTALLERMKPDLIIADEGHKLRHRDTAGTGRLVRYFVDNPNTRFCTWSGTFAKGSIKDFAHLVAFALGARSPLPIDPQIVDEWAAALDPSDWPAPPGALKKFIEGDETLQEAVHKRIVMSCGVVATKESAIDASINIYERHPPAVPERIRYLLDYVRNEWKRPDGYNIATGEHDKSRDEELVDPLSRSRCLRELSCGFFYRWKFPRGEPEDLIDEWYKRRGAYHRELRPFLARRLPHLDSPLLCANAAIRAWQDVRYEGELPVWPSVCWPAWREIRDLVYHESEAIWIDDYLARDAAAWASKHRGIVWYEHDAFGRKVAEIGEFAMHGGGADAEARILAESGKRSIVASIKSHGEQRDGLQRKFCLQLIANPPTNGAAWEQLLGRLHRTGQSADEVDSWVYRHTEEMADAIDKAVSEARWMRGLMGSHQKLLMANCDFSIV